MAHFDYTRTGGIWVTAPPNPLLAAELADFDLKIFKSINGDDGGSWAPAAAIAIGGAGLALGGSNHQVLSGGTVAWLNGSLLQVNASAAATFLCTVALDGGATVASAHSLTMSSGSTFTASAGSNVGIQTGSHVTAGFDSSCTVVFGSGCNLTVHTDAAADVTLGDAASFTITGTCAASVANGATLSCAGTLAVASGGLLTVASGGGFNLAEGSSASFHDAVIPVGKGRVRERVTYLASDANATTDIETTSNVVLPAGILSADRKLTVANTGADNGDIMHVQNNDPSRVLSVYQADGVTLIAHTKQASTNWCWLKLSYRTAVTRWEVIGAGAGA